MFWFYLALLAYFLDAVVFVIDKYLIVESIPHPTTYAFFISILSLFVVVLIPFGFHMISVPLFLISFLSGFVFFLGLVFLYRSLKLIDVTEVMPIIGALTAVVTFILSIYILNQHFVRHEYIAFLFLVIGTFLMSYFHIFSFVIFDIMLASLGLGGSYVLLKYVFNHTDFISGLIWTRSGLVISALFLLLIPKIRKDIFSSFHKTNHESKFIFIFNKLLAGFAFFLLYYAINIGNVVFVNAMQGIQYVFVLIIGAFLLKIMPKLFERHSRDFTWRKIIATGFIIAGLILLFA